MRYYPLLVVLVVLVVAAVSSACVVQSSQKVDRSRFTETVCADRNTYDPLAGTTPADPEVYIELVYADAGRGTGAGLNANPRFVRARRGSPCNSATNRDTCLANIASANSTAQTWFSEKCGGAGCRSSVAFFVVERRGEVRVVDTNEGLRATFAPVNNAADAVLLAIHAADLEGMDCTSPQARRSADGAYDVFLGHGDGTCTDRVERVVRVRPDGLTETLEAVTRPASEQCVSP